MAKTKSAILVNKCALILIQSMLIFICLLSCNNSHIESITNANDIETIKVLPDNGLISVNFTDYFSAWKVIPLETNSNSLIGKIGRISVFKSDFYILDTYTNSVLKFNSEGKFLYKIHKVGNGEGEYIGLMDFTIDEKNNQIILYTHRPYKLLYYDLLGKFIQEKRMNNLYYNISISDKNLLFLNSKINEGFMVYSINKETKNEKRIMPMLRNSDYFAHFKLNTPSIIRGKSTILTFPYIDTVYEAKGNQISAKYYLDFGSKKFPEEILKKKLSPSEVYKLALDNDYGFGISNFKELNDMAYFSYGSNICVFYFKASHKSITFRFVKNDENLLEFANIFSHDGVDKDLISIYPATRFKLRMAMLKDSKMYNNLPVSIQRIDAEITEVSNPLLLIYTIR